MHKFFSRLGFALATLLLTAALPHAQSAQAADNALESIKKTGVLAVAVPQDFPPFGSVGSDMQPVGYDIDTARLIAKSLGVVGAGGIDAVGQVGQSVRVSLLADVRIGVVVLERRLDLGGRLRAVRKFHLRFSKNLQHAR